MNKSLIEIIQGSIESVINQMAMALPKLIGAIVLLLFGWILAKVVSVVIGKLLTRIGLDKLAEKLNETDAFKEANITIKPVIIIKKTLYWFILLIFMLSAAETLELNIVTEQIGSLIEYIPKLMTAVIILAIGFYLSNALREMVADACKSMGIPAWKFISSTLFYFVLLMVIVTALNQAQIPTEMITSNVSIIIGGILLAFAVAYGFAARNVLASILASFYTRNNFEVDQVIEIDGHVGRIIFMDNTSLTLDIGEKHIVYPLSRLTSDMVIIHKNKSE